MLVWVASFPRSGSALTRAILWQCFGIHVETPLREKPAEPLPEPDEGTLALRAYFGHSPFPPDLTLDEAVPAARKADRPVLIKTHALPEDLPARRARALVIVRDGRPVMVSYARFRLEVTGREIPLARILDGRPIDWSHHVNAWLDREAPQLILRYEKLRIGEQATLDAISRFIGLPQIAPFTVTPEELRALRPTHVRVAANEPGVEEIERDHGEAFWSRHGATMARLGYRR